MLDSPSRGVTNMLYRAPLSDDCAAGAVRMRPHRPDQASVAELHFPELRQRCHHAQPFHVCRIDSAHQRFDEPLEYLTPEATAHERRHALVAVVSPGRKKILAARTQLSQRAEDRCQGHRPQSRRRHHQEAVRQAVQPTAPDHERMAVGGIGLDQLASQSDAPAQIHAPRHGGDEVVGTLFDLEALLVDRLEHAAQPIAGFEEDELNAGIQFHQAVRGCKARNPPSDHGDSPDSP